jgi:putative copper export protein
LLVESLRPEMAEATIAQLRMNVSLELFLGTVVIIVIAILGILPPAIH